MKQEFIEKVIDLSYEIRNAGHIDAANNLILGVFAPALDDHFRFDREQLGAHIQALSQAANKNGFKYTAWNLAYVGLALLAGEETEVEFGVEMAPHGKELEKRFKQSNFYWPDEID